VLPLTVFASTTTYFGLEKDNQVFGALQARQACRQVAGRPPCPLWHAGRRRAQRLALGDSVSRPGTTSQCYHQADLGSPDSGHKCLRNTAFVRGTAKISLNQLVPASTDAVPGARLKEDMLLIILANDAGWKSATQRKDGVHELRVVPVMPDSNPTADTAQHRFRPTVCFTCAALSCAQAVSCRRHPTAQNHS